MPRLQSSLKLSFTLLATLFLTLGQSAHALQPGSCLTTDQPQVILENELTSLNWQADGNLSLKLKAKHGGDILWQPPTYNGGKSLCLLDEGNLIIAAEKINFAKSVPIDLKPGQCLTAGKTIASNEIVSLIWQDDGNLVLYQLPTGKAKKGRAVWATNTWQTVKGSPNKTLCFNEHGELAIYQDAGEKLWATATVNQGKYLELGPNCDLRVLNHKRKPVWQSRKFSNIRDTDKCNLKIRPLWKADNEELDPPSKGHKLSQKDRELKLSKCQLFLSDDHTYKPLSLTTGCIPEIRSHYQGKNDQLKIRDYYAHAREKYRKSGTETSHKDKPDHSSAIFTPYIRLFDLKRFSSDFFSLINHSYNDLDSTGALGNAISSIEYRGVWKLCTDSNFKGECIEIKSKNVARISDVAKELGDNWNDAISSVKLLGYIDTESDYLIRARFGDTRKICAHVTEKSNTSYTFQLTDLDNQLLTNSGGRKSECKLSFTDSETKKCCDTGYDGTDSPVYLSWQKQRSLPASQNRMLSLRITSDEKLQHGKVAEAALQEIEITEEESVSDQVKLCINGQSRHCARSATASEE